MPSELDERWDALVKAVEQKFWAHDQHPGGGVFRPDRASLTLSAAMGGDTYFGLPLTEDVGEPRVKLVKDRR